MKTLTWSIRLASATVALWATRSFAGAGFNVVADDRTLEVWNGTDLGITNHDTFTAPGGLNYTGSLAAPSVSSGMVSLFSPSVIHLEAASVSILHGKDVPWDLGLTFAMNHGSTHQDVTFRLDLPAVVTITGYKERALYGAWEYSLTGPLGVIPLPFTGVFENDLNTTVTLAPGDYDLVVGTAIETWVTDPSDMDSSRVSIRMNLQTTLVPDETSTCALMLVGCALLALTSRARLTWRRGGLRPFEAVCVP